MRGATLALIGGIVVLVVWAYQRHAFDGILGLSIPHDETARMNAANINLTIKRTDATSAAPYGPMFDPAGVKTSTAATGPVFSPAYRTALGRVHEPGGARDPFRDVSDGVSWLGGDPGFSRSLGVDRDPHFDRALGTDRDPGFSRGRLN